MPFFSVFTPTYNRAHTLPRLYESLKKQEFKDFEWIIVDDGSSDSTEMLFEQWKKENTFFDIRYTKTENGGKPRAINLGVQCAHGRFFFMLDSDDFLYPDALKKMYAWCEEIQYDTRYIGVGAAKGFPNGSYLKGTGPKVNKWGYIDATNLERGKYDMDADMCEAYKTDIFKKFPMAEWEGETFAPEQIALNEIALAGYKLRWHADIIYCCDYLEDGLTKGSRLLEKKNPMGYAMMYNHMLKYPNYTFKQKFHVACQHIALSIYGQNWKYILKSNNNIYTFFAMPLGILLSFRRKKQFKDVE